jgi:hypothetical protein
MSRSNSRVQIASVDHERGIGLAGRFATDLFSDGGELEPASLGLFRRASAGV